MSAVINGGEILQSRVGPTRTEVVPYSEEEINEVARDLFKKGKQTWSENPRLYVILRDIGQVGCQPQLIDKLIENGVSDLWIPITSEFLLSEILPEEELHSHFLHAQRRVCVQPLDFRLGLGSVHGHFATTKDSPFEVLQSIGTGRVGHVEKVVGLVDGKVYARKRVRKESFYNNARNRIHRFRCELEVLRRIKHRHCVEIVRVLISYRAP
jgi:hypothetical protein